MRRNREQLAWAAGLFEGEGCISLSVKGNNRNIRVVVASTDLDVLEQFKEWVGLGVIYGPKQPAGNRKLRWDWQVGSFEHVQAIAAMLWPWLCSRRRATIRRLFHRYHTCEAALPRSLAASRARANHVRTALATGTETQAAIAARFGISPATVTYIKQTSTTEEAA